MHTAKFLTTAPTLEFLPPHAYPEIAFVGRSPGIYNLYTAQAADKKQTHAGVIVHADATNVYQQIGKNFVMHARSDFDKVPEIGSAKSISYNAQGKAAVAAEAPKLTRGRSM